MSQILTKPEVFEHVWTIMFWPNLKFLEVWTIMFWPNLKFLKVWTIRFWPRLKFSKFLTTLSFVNTLIVAHLYLLCTLKRYSIIDKTNGFIIWSLYGQFSIWVVGEALQSAVFSGSTQYNFSSGCAVATVARSRPRFYANLKQILLFQGQCRF